jgi:hypothetical protein
MNMELKELTVKQIMRWRGVVHGPDAVETRFQIESEPGADSLALFQLELTANFAHARMSDVLVREILTPMKNDFRGVKFIKEEDAQQYMIQ